MSPRAALLLVLAVTSACQSQDEKTMARVREDLAGHAAQGFLPSIADACDEGARTLEYAKKPKARKAFREECAKALVANWEAVRAKELASARNPKKSSPEWTAKNAERMQKFFASMAEVDPSLPEKWKALTEERARVEQETDAASAKADAAAVAGKVLFWTDGFEDSDLDGCIRPLLEPLTPAPRAQWISRRGQPAPEVAAAASAVIPFKADMQWSEYVGREGGSVAARVPGKLKVWVELDVPGQKHRSWTAEAAAANPESIAGTGANSARGEAAKLMGAQVQDLYQQICTQLRARIVK